LKRRPAERSTADDAGTTGALRTAAESLDGPFDYHALEADPNNADVVYVGMKRLVRDADGGKTFRNAQGRRTATITTCG